MATRKVVYKCPKCNAHKEERVYDPKGIKCANPYCKEVMKPAKVTNNASGNG